MIKISLKIIWFSLLIQPFSRSDSFFFSCDTDNDKKLTHEEFQQCLSSLNGIKSPLSSTEESDSQLSTLIDVNSDNFITLKEYKKAVANLQKQSNEENFSFTSHTGEIKTVPKSELMGKMENLNDGIKRIGDKLTKEETDVGNINDIGKKNPNMVNFIKIGNWSNNALCSINVTCGKIKKLKSFPIGGSVNDHDDDLYENNEIQVLSPHSNFTLWLMFTIESYTSHNLINYEVCVEYNPQEYIKPHLAIKNAWELNSKGKRIKSLPIPTPRVRGDLVKMILKCIASIQVQPKSFIQFLIVFIVGIVTILIISCFI